MLPDGFEWRTLTMNGGPKVSLCCNGTEVARIDDRVNGSWFAMLDRHLGDVTTPILKRDCSSFDNGRAGIELWATRHQDRIRREVAEREARRRGGAAPEATR